MQLYWPVDKLYITQRFGERPAYYKRYGLAGHDGIDLRVRFIDSPLGRRYISAAADGVVEQERYDKTGYGNHLRIRHADGSLTIYGHNTKLYVRKGQRVRAQQIIALSGSSGDSTAPHCHFEYRPAGWEQHTGNGYAGAVNQLGDHKTGWPNVMLSTLPKQFWG